MSAAHDAHQAHAAHLAHAFDGEPVQVLSPDEPRTPGWLPVVGLALFVAAGVALLTGSDKPDATAEPAAAVAAPPAQPAVTAAPTPAVRQLMPNEIAQPAAPAATGLPAGAGSGAVRRLTPDQVDKLKKQIDQAKAKAGAQPRPPKR